jgi:hypothetical protein
MMRMIWSFIAIIVDIIIVVFFNVAGSDIIIIVFGMV